MSEINQLIQPMPWAFFSVQGLFFLLIGYIGYRASRNVKTLSDFFVMNGKAGVIISGFAYFSTQYGITVFMGMPSVIYGTGFAGMSITLPGVIFTMIVPTLLVGRKLMLMGKKYGFLTMSDYLADRFDSKAIRVLHAIMCIIFLICMIAVQTVGAGIIFHAFTGFPEWIGVVSMGIIVTLYCSSGGMRGAMMTDVLQGVLMISTAVITFVASVYAGGGFEAISQKLMSIDPGYLTHPGIKQNFPWTTYVSMIILWNFFTIAQPILFTKFFAMKNYKVMFKAVILGTLGMFICATMINWSGVNAIVVIPGITGKDTDFIIPLLLQNSLNPILASILISGIFSAGMSTIDALLVVITGSITIDLYKNLINPKATQQHILNLSRYVIIAVGMLGIFIGVSKPTTLFELLRFIFGGLGIWAAPIILGMYWKGATRTGAITSVIVGEAIYLAIRLWYPELAFGFDPLIVSWGCAMVCLYLVSLCTQRTDIAVIKRHFDDLVIPTAATVVEVAKKPKSQPETLPQAA